MITKIITKKNLFALIISISVINIFSISLVTAQNPSVSWTSQSTGCQPVSGNINGQIDYVYLGSGGTVPESIKNLYPSANAGYLEAWKTNMVGMSLNQFKSFILTPDQGYPSGDLAGKNLFFETTILAILNNDGTGITSRTSVVNVRYSLYTDCQVITTTSGQTSNSQSSSTSTDTGIVPPSPPDYTIPIIGGIISVSILGTVGYIIISSRNPNLNTEKIIQQNKIRESKNIQSLKESLKSDIKATENYKKKPSSARRRR